MRTPPIAYRLSAVRQRASLFRTPIPQRRTPQPILLRRLSTEGLNSTTITPAQQPRPLSAIPETTATSPKTSSGLHVRISRVLSGGATPRQGRQPTDPAAASLPPSRPNIYRYITEAPPHYRTEVPVRITSTPRRIRKRQHGGTDTAPQLVHSTIANDVTASLHPYQQRPRRIWKRQHEGTDTAPQLVHSSIANDVTASLHPYQQTCSFLGNFSVKIVPDQRYVKISRGEPLFLFQEPEGLNARVKKVRVENFNGATVGYLPDHTVKFLVQLMAARFLSFAGMYTGTMLNRDGNLSAMVEVHFTSPWEKEAKELWKHELARNRSRQIKHQTTSAFTPNVSAFLRTTSIADEITQSLRPPQKIVSYGFFHSSIIGTNHFAGQATTSTGEALIIRRDNFPKNTVRASTVDGVTVGYLSPHQAGCFADYLKEGVLKLEAVVTKIADHEFPHDLPVKIELLGHEARKDELARLFEHLERTWNFQRTA